MSFIRRLLNPNGGVSSRRFIALVMTVHFVATSFYSLLSKTTIANIQLQVQILEYEFWIIIGGFGFITVADFGRAFIESAKAKIIRAESGEPENTVNVENVESIDLNKQDG